MAHQGQADEAGAFIGGSRGGATWVAAGTRLSTRHTVGSHEFQGSIDQFLPDAIASPRGVNGKHVDFPSIGVAEDISHLLRLRASGQRGGPAVPPLRTLVSRPLKNPSCDAAGDSGFDMYSTLRDGSAVSVTGVAVINGSLYEIALLNGTATSPGVIGTNTNRLDRVQQSMRDGRHLSLATSSSNCKPTASRGAVYRSEFSRTT